MPSQHIGRAAVERECQKAHGICKISKPITPHSLVDELFMKYFSDLALREDDYLLGQYSIR